MVEKLEHVADGPKKGKITSVTTIRTIDATIFDDGQGGEPAHDRARGPRACSRPGPARDKPVERTAYLGGPPGHADDEVGRDNRSEKRVTLTGHPEFIDLRQASLDAEKEIVVWLTPKPKTAIDSAAGAETGAASSSPSASPTAPGVGAIRSRSSNCEPWGTST